MSSETLVAWGEHQASSEKIVSVTMQVFYAEVANEK